jgi:hypothetical protein
MQRKLRLAAAISLALISIAFIVAYFVKPHPLSIERALAPEDLQTLPDHSSETPISIRISKSHGLALVFVISEFSQKNAMALGAVRAWATDKFEKDPTFLYGEQTAPRLEIPPSIFSSFAYNLLAGPRILAEDQALDFVRATKQVFHQTEAYAQLKSDFYESFGRDKESALLLANYEFERAKESVPVLLSACFWLLMVILGIYRAGWVHKSMRDKIQMTLSGLWFILATFYLIETWTQNSVQVMLSSLLCAAIGFYLRRPIVWSRDDDRGLSFRLVTLGSKSLALVSFVTLCFMGIHLLTWIKTGTLENPDPITLLTSALTGNFFHDPLDVKRNIKSIIGILWLACLAWCMRILTLEREPDLEAPEKLDQLKDMPPLD